MNILYTGKLNEFGTLLCNKLVPENKVFVYSKDEELYQLNTEVCRTKEKLTEVVGKTSIECAVLYPGNETDLQIINDDILTLIENGIKNILYIQEGTFICNYTNRSEVMDVLCNEYADKYGIAIKMVKSSCIFGAETCPDYFEKMAKQISSRNEINPNGNAEDYCDCIHAEDLCNAVICILMNSNKENGFSLQEVQSGYPFKLKSFIELVTNRYKQATLLPYSGDGISCINKELSFQDSSWSPTHSFLSESELLFDFVENTQNDLRKTKRGKIVASVFKCISLLAIFALIEIYTQFITVSSDLQYVDLRLLFIVGCSLLYGEIPGLIAAMLCSATSVISNLLAGTKWYVLFYHVDNWIPIAVYFVAAIAVSAYRKNLLNNRNQSEEL